MSEHAPMIVLENLTKRFGPFTAVDSISLNVSKGEVLGFLGPNGAGKSTTMRMVTGFLPITSGAASVCGFDVAIQPLEARRRVGYLPEGAPLYGDMATRNFLGFIADARGFTGSDKTDRVEDAVKRLALESVVNQPIDTLSKGYKRRVGLAQAILHDPDVLILDEPTDGLDPNQKHQVRELIKEMAAEKAIVISTHILEEVTAVCSRATIIARGKIVFDGTPDELQSKAPHHNAVAVRLANADGAAIRDALAGLPDVERVEQPNGASTLLVIPKNGASIVEQVGGLVRDRGAEVDELYVERGHLDDVFRQLTLSE